MSSPSTPSSGLRVRCRRHAVAPTVAVRVWLPGGSLDEDRAGEALVTGRLLTEGTSAHSWSELADLAEARGIDLSGLGGLEAIGVAVDALASDWRRALELTAESALRATFPEDRLKHVRRRTSSELDSLSERSEVVAAWGFLRQIYGSTHPLGRPLQGSSETLAVIRRVDCVACHRRALDSGVLVSMAGDLDEDEATAAIEELFSGAPPAGRAPSLPPPQGDPEGDPEGESGIRRREVALPPGDQAQIYVGHLTVAADHPDVAALQIAGVVLGSGPGLVGRIPARVREREGLAYSTGASLVGGSGRIPGRLVVHLATAPRQVEAALLAVREEIDRLVGDGISQQEFEEARRYLLGSEPFRRESARQIAALGARSMLYGVDFDAPDWLSRALEPLDRRAVNAAIRRHVDPDRLAATVGVPSRPS